MKNTDRRSGKCLRYETRAETRQKCLFIDWSSIARSPCCCDVTVSSALWAEIRRTLVFSSLHMLLTLWKALLRVCEEMFNSTLVVRINLKKTINSSAQWRQTACFHSAGSHVWQHFKIKVPPRQTCGCGRKIIYFENFAVVF